jgi:hypothetical protein
MKPPQAGRSVIVDEAVTAPEAASTPFTSSQASPLFFLPKKLWSPRYESSFYSVTIEACGTVTGTEADDGLDRAAALLAPPAPVRGNTRLPAVYYQVTVHREHSKKVVWRRYSHFVWLYGEWVADPLPRDPPDPSALRNDSNGRTPCRSVQGGVSLPPPPSLPSGSCSLFWWALPKHMKASFAEQRRADLDMWLQDALCLADPAGHSYASHPATIAFLELLHDR